jgi:hypothetical protein
MVGPIRWVRRQPRRGDGAGQIDEVARYCESDVLNISEAIKKKSNELERYRAAAGPDIRLLLVADRIHNSGKLVLDDAALLDTEGFQIVYVFPYPEPVISSPRNVMRHECVTSLAFGFSESSPCGFFLNAANRSTHPTRHDHGDCVLRRRGHEDLAILHQHSRSEEASPRVFRQVFVVLTYNCLGLV